MGVIVQFSFATFAARYPEFAAVNPATAQLWFNEAGLYNRNDGGGPVNDAAVQLMLMNMLTAHIGMMAGALNPIGNPESAVVGRISSATEGSVSVQVDYDTSAKPGTQAWAIQTQYGAAWWQATLQFRSARYSPGWCAGVGAGWGPGRFGGAGNYR